MKERGRFITLEGGEGAGKSTHAKRLAAFLRDKGVPVVLTREPGGSPRAEVLRGLLLSGRFASAGPDAEALAFAVARIDHLAETIRPALAAGIWVVCDRFFDSTRAYQGTAGADPRLLDLLDEIVVRGDRPDLTLILDVPPEAGLTRMRHRDRSLDRFESEDLAAHKARRRAFIEIAASEPKRCIVIDATRSPDEVAESVCAAVGERLDLDVG